MQTLPFQTEQFLGLLNQNMEVMASRNSFVGLFFFMWHRLSFFKNELLQFLLTELLRVIAPCRKYSFPSFVSVKLLYFSTNKRNLLPTFMVPAAAVENLFNINSHFNFCHVLHLVTLNTLIIEHKVYKTLNSVQMLKLLLFDK